MEKRKGKLSLPLSLTISHVIMSASHPACASTHKLYGEGRVFPMATLIASNLPHGKKKPGGTCAVRERRDTSVSCHFVLS